MEPTVAPTYDQLAKALADASARGAESDRLLAEVRRSRALQLAAKVRRDGADDVLVRIASHLATPAPILAPPSTPEHRARAVRDDFHRQYYDAADATWRDTRWFGVPIYKLPLDLWVYQELLVLLRPGLIVETGTFHGGSALYLSHLCELLGHGRVVTIDITTYGERPEHDRLTYLSGSSVDPAVLEQVRALAAGEETVLVVLDSDHGEEHVLAELHAYADLVTTGSYLIVEDTNVNGHPVLADHGPGPAEAVARFLAERDDFVVDAGCEKLLVSFNPGGYLKRVR